MTKYGRYIVFCVEHYSAHKGMNGADVWRLFRDHDVMGFIVNTYEALHTQSKNETIADIDAYLATV